MSKDKRHPSIHFLAWARLLRAHKVLLEQVQAALAQAALPPLEWYDLLLELELADGGRLRFAELGERIVLSRSNLTRLCDRLEKEALIAREKCEEDRRGLYAVLTTKGGELRKRMWPVYKQAVQTHFSAHMSAQEAEILAGLLQRYRAPA
jgi:DNA-binding MarR family transcriptional regulator